MATLTIEGKKVKVDDAFLSMTPEQQADTVDDIAAQMKITPNQPEPVVDEEEKAPEFNTQENLAALEKEDGAVRNLNTFVKGSQDAMSFGLADEAGSFIQSMLGKIDPFAPDKAGDYDATLERLRNEQKARDNADPAASIAGKVAGSVVGAGALGKVGAPFLRPVAGASLGGKVAQGVAGGALYGGAYGAGGGEGVGGRISSAAEGAATGAALGGAIPVVGAGLKAAFSPLIDAVGARINPGKFADQKIAERLTSAGTTPEQAAAKMANGTGLSLADVGGKTTQNLLKTASNIPGPAQQKIYTRLVLKAMQQGDRIRSSIKATFADPDGYLTAKDEIADTAQKLAAPLYKKAYDTPIPFSKSLEDILQTPAVKRALGKAQEKMANSQTEFRQMFANVADDGTVTIKRVPDTQGWDYIKRALDDEIGILRRTGANDDVRILTQLKNKMLGEVDSANPTYAEARKIWSGQASLDDALEAGRVAMGQSPEATKRMVSGFSQAEKDSFKIGFADALRKKIGDTNFTQNALLKFFSNKNQLGNIKAAFDNDAEFSEFRKAMFDEARKRSTYNIVTGNSSTAKQLADMADAGGLKDTIDFVKNTTTAGPISATLGWVGSRLKMLGGFTPEVADQVAKRLLSSDPNAAKQITGELMRIESMKIAADQKRQLVMKLISPVVSGQQPTQNRVSPEFNNSYNQGNAL